MFVRERCNLVAAIVNITIPGFWDICIVEGELRIR